MGIFRALGIEKPKKRETNKHERDREKERREIARRLQSLQYQVEVIRRES